MTDEKDKNQLLLLDTATVNSPVFHSDAYFFSVTFSKFSLTFCLVPHQLCSSAVIIRVFVPFLSISLKC